MQCPACPAFAPLAQLERLSLRKARNPLPTAEEQGLCIGSLFTICATNGYDVSRKINFFGFCQSAEFLFEHVEDAVVSRGGEVFETERQLKRWAWGQGRGWRVHPFVWMQEEAWARAVQGQGKELLRSSIWGAGAESCSFSEAGSIACKSSVP